MNYLRSSLFLRYFSGEILCGIAGGSTKPVLPTRKTVQFRREKCPIAPRGQSRSLIRLAGGRLAIPQANRTGGLYRALGVVFSHSQALDGSNLRISVNGCSLRTGRNLHRGRRNLRR